MAQNTATGRIDRIFEKEWEGKDGVITLYSFKLDGNDMFFRTGTDPIPANEGDPVEFLWEPKGRNAGEVLITSFKEVDEGSLPKTAPKKPKAGSTGGKSRSSTGRSGASGGTTRDNYWENKAKRDAEITEPRISYSAAQRNATALVCAALEHDVLSFGNTAKGKRLDMMVDFVEQTTLRLAQLQLDAPTILSEAEKEESTSSRSDEDFDDDE